ncbi:phospholipid-binding protein MlaC [Geobacter sp. SVR]|uniref:MlaC/ttg2D family ABC transporter substrate-binding protein n=1 Tax=Geobacter sp. SVR TaxID=2495594 RepID=UPI00143F01DC|nr:ABC transporter substrate-binding protein [Geobacter sp. SVR]BCS55594.1 organic solvent tolerance ABC transporter substrate-binding protein [Geobacter sp. SVR]GCF83597.1 organic solvent tolerance ABC transporter substrate-binding protein [Geobacter sp. SVR]
MLKRIITLAMTGVFLASYAFATPTDDVKKTVDEVVRIVADKDMKKQEQKRRQALKKSISQIFDYGEMAKRSLGKHWNQRTPAERKQFVELFASLLENSYAGKIESYNNEKIAYIKETTEDDHAEVKSKVITAKRDEFTLDYRLLKENGKWMVYDVVIEGVSLVSNYRSQFNRIITSNGYSELIKKLQTKTEELKAP